ncbi:hypothetical protein SPSIL_032250 [Sporomusa silvacetica DSM 10669]|uniref:4-oxalocrotonate tautomerase-like domain-containing protein n=1 Tax=Sporomusa silvacetica DSM 10669 TaxID=1123289 RepID=A0ABZ3INS7_9FIRM|nr:4-oxalocrotonate tautomerase DmpI [Sporomusa silvacetica]OZC18230.1 tautomerase enzyme [Sporomusa silvacetica DSM 10669]
MPVITIEGPQMSKDKKRQLVRELTKTASDVIQLPVEIFTVLIKENDHDNVARLNTSEALSVTEMLAGQEQAVRLQAAEDEVYS